MINQHGKNVNLYNNSLSNAVAKIALTGEYTSIQGKIRTPEVTGQGAYAKCWRRINGNTYLYKAASKQGNGIEHKLDVLSSTILDILGIEHVKYTLTKIENREVSKCVNMTTEDISICEMEYFEGYCNRNNINLNKWLSNQKLYYKMLIVDYLIFNTDRHSGNWGVYFSSNSGEVLGLHPLYDHNNSFDSNGDYMSKVINGKTLEECAKYAKSKIEIDIKPLEKWAESIKTKKVFQDIFGNLDEYKAFIKRIERYKTW